MFDLTYQITPRAVTISASRLQTPQPRTPILANPVIVFGPTGNIARVASTTAHERGATVYLAMRNPNKPIPGLSQDAESSGRYTRLQADLHQPDTVAAAVKASGAKRAFIYVAHGSKDHMNATLLALKDSGITFVVFLGSFTVTDPASEMDASDPIAYVHAQVEVNLETSLTAEATVPYDPDLSSPTRLGGKQVSKPAIWSSSGSISKWTASRPKTWAVSAAQSWPRAPTSRSTMLCTSTGHS
jgi:NAD(P)-dependent dehydrogenase (short-subunit alcohol dehydrogenase family)